MYQNFEHIFDNSPFGDGILIPEPTTEIIYTLTHVVSCTVFMGAVPWLAATRAELDAVIRKLLETRQHPSARLQALYDANPRFYVRQMIPIATNDHAQQWLLQQDHQQRVAFAKRFDATKHCVDNHHVHLLPYLPLQGN